MARLEANSAFHATEFDDAPQRHAAARSQFSSCLWLLRARATLLNQLGWQRRKRKNGMNVTKRTKRKMRKTTEKEVQEAIETQSLTRWRKRGLCRPQNNQACTLVAVKLEQRLANPGQHTANWQMASSIVGRHTAGTVAVTLPADLAAWPVARNLRHQPLRLARRLWCRTMRAPPTWLAADMNSDPAACRCCCKKSRQDCAWRHDSSDGLGRARCRHGLSGWGGARCRDEI